MMKLHAALGLALVLGFAPFTAAMAAQNTSPIGIWRTIDDKTGQARGRVEIAESSGHLTGKLIGRFARPGDRENPVCAKCDGERKNQPLIGMTLLWGLHKDGEEYTGGEILDPESGSIYQARMKLVGDGNKLEVRGFIGMSLLGRSQIWVRED